MRKIKHLYTEAGERLKGDEYNVYPRPQLKRESFFSLNGQWHFSYRQGERLKINVPYPPESLLSGINKDMGKSPNLTYSRSFTLPKDFLKDRLILNFGAVDQICLVYINGKYVGKNVGGYNHFSFDITKYIKDGKNEITLQVRDNLSSKVLPYGKQTHKPGGMWYTPVSGIWQSVWLESVPDEYIKAMRIQAANNSAKIYFTGINEGKVTLKGEENTSFPIEQGVCNITIDSPRMWSPSDPYLYYFTVEAGEDKIESYFALRTLEIKECEGKARILLNGEPIFFHGVLDQGYFSDGIYTPATPMEYESDVLKMKELGFNTLRKHIKVEPDLFYYACDKHGMIVFQDFVNNGSYSFLRDTALPTVFTKKFPEGLMLRTSQQKEAFKEGVKKTVNQLFNHPCVCYWTIFNEGWGQFDSDEMYDFLKKLDPTRIIDTTSGWFKGKRSDVESLHIYFKPVKLTMSDKPIILSEFGGYSYKVDGHCANEHKTYGYKLYKQVEDFEKGLEELYMAQVVPQIENGLCGSIYTQLSDVEDETNGLYTYDRRVCKVDKATMLKIAEHLKI